jgi:peptidoglycan/xylan/chitin deacetylase (PgdA/CDA1 family)
MKKLSLIFVVLAVLLITASTLSNKSFILYYHNVGTYKFGLKGAYISPRAFAWQMQYLKFRGYKTVPLEEFVDYLKSGASLPKKIFAITFDDGYLDNYQNAFPILQHLDYTATVFIPTDHVDKMIGYGTNAPEQRLSWNEIGVMSREWDFASHGVTHNPLTILAPDEIKRELTESRNVIQKMLGKEMDLFCYPYGAFHDLAIRSLKEAAYKAAVINDTGLIGKTADQNMYALPRIEWRGLNSPSIRNLWDLKWFYLKILLGV